MSNVGWIPFCSAMPLHYIGLNVKEAKPVIKIEHILFLVWFEFGHRNPKSFIAYYKFSESMEEQSDISKWGKSVCLW